MTAPQEKAIREALPVVAWRYVPSRIWNDVVLTNDASRAALAVEMGRHVDDLVLKSDAESQLAELRAEVAQCRNAALEEAANAVEQHDRKGREWIPTSLWGTLSNEAAARIRALKEDGRG